MGYKKSFNLVTLQLIIPLSTMTKAEYKNAYGIDLDDIDIEKVTLLQEDGSKNKYFVDEIKTTENGIDIYAGGKILSIGSSVSVVNDAYSVENSKPIYCHPIEIRVDNSNYTICMTMLVFNNSSTPFTLSTFKDWIDNLYALVGGTTRIMISGGSLDKATSNLIINSFFYRDPSSYGIFGVKNDGTLVQFSDTWANLFDSISAFNDGVNKIN